MLLKKEAEDTATTRRVVSLESSLVDKHPVSDGKEEQRDIRSRANLTGQPGSWETPNTQKFLEKNFGLDGSSPQVQH